MILLSNNETVNDTQWNCSGHNQYGVLLNQLCQNKESIPPPMLLMM